MGKMCLTDEDRELFKHIYEKTGKKIELPNNNNSYEKIQPKINTIENNSQKQQTTHSYIPSNTNPGHLQKKCQNTYTTILNNYLYAPERDIKQGNTKTIKLNQNGLEKLVSSEKEYNSYILFTNLAAILPKSSVLYYGEPGTGKTIASELITHLLFGIPIENIQEATIYGNPEMTTSDVLVYTDLAKLVNQGIEIVHSRNFIKSFIRIIDEVNRIPPSQLSILYQVADRGFAVYKNKKVQAPPGPLFATANYKDSGNYSLPKPFIDRFDISLTTSQLNPSYFSLLNKPTLNQMSNRLNKQELVTIQEEIANVTWEKDALSRLTYFLSEINYCALGGREIEKKQKSNLTFKKPGNLCDECGHYCSEGNICNKTEEGISVRTYKSIDKFCKAFSWWIGKSKIGIEELEAVIPYTLAHKLTPTKHAKDPIYQNDRVTFIRDLFEASNKSYDKAMQNAPILHEITTLIAQAYTNGISHHNKNEIERILTQEIPKLDSPAKFGYAVALHDLWCKLK